MDEFIKQLADDEFETREKATTELVRLGTLAVPALQRATKSTDPEQARRAETCLQGIDRQKSPAIIGAAVRLLAVRKPDGAVETLLSYLPSAGDASEIDEISQAMSRLGVRDGRPHRLLLQALADKDAVKRRVAGVALARAGLAGKEPWLRLLLADPDAEVRFHVAIALLTARDKEALPVLIDQLKEASAEHAGTIEEILCYLAGDKAPAAVAGYDQIARLKRHDNWLGWWKEHGAKLSLDKVDLDKRQLGYTVLALFGAGANGCVREVDRSGKIRWQLDNLAYPVEAQVLPRDRVLIAEYRSRQVTERDLKNQVLWQYQAPGRSWAPGVWRTAVRW